MKKLTVLLLAILMIASLLVGCGASAGQEADAAEQNVGAETEMSTPAPDAGNAPSYHMDENYAKQVERYYVALSEKWNEGKYIENNMSGLPSYYYEGNPLDNAGFGFVDLDNDGSEELVIGAILNAERDPAVFEIWTLVDGKPVMLAQGGTRNRYVLQYVEEDEMWYVANEGSNSAANFGTHYLMLNEGKFEVVQGIVFDAVADEQNPWFMTYDLDWDVSNDMPIDEDTAAAIMESYRVHYTALEYVPFSLYR